MRFSFSFKLATTFSLLLIIIVGLIHIFFTSSSTHASETPLRSTTKTAVSCGAWNVIASPNLLTGNNVLYGVVALSTSNVWATGYYTDSLGFDQTLIEHWDGMSWSIISSPNPGPGGNILNGVVAINAKSVWAVGASSDISGNNVQALIEHWNGKSWQFVSSPNASEQLTGIIQVPGTKQLWADESQLNSDCPSISGGIINTQGSHP